MLCVSSVPSWYPLFRTVDQRAGVRATCCPPSRSLSLSLFLFALLTFDLCFVLFAERLYHSVPLSVTSARVFVCKQTSVHITSFLLMSFVYFVAHFPLFPFPSPLSPRACQLFNCPLLSFYYHVPPLPSPPRGSGTCSESLLCSNLLSRP